MTDIKLVPFTSNHFNDVDRLFLELQLHEHQFDTAKTIKPESATKYRQELIDSIEENSGQMWIATDSSGTVYGLIAWFTENEVEYDLPYGYISDIVVTKESRNQGIGKMLIEKAIEEIKKSGLKRIHIGVLLANTETKEYYKKFGFEEYSVEMLKNL